MVTAMVNAMFHRGDYLSIRFEDLNGEPWIERAAELKVEAVPAWFVAAFRLHAPERAASMMSGWRQVGRVVVISHPGLAYQKLWSTSRQTLNLFLIGAVLVLLVGLVALRILLRPLRAVELQAEAICNREFPVVEGRPFTLEFRRVVEAMNRLSAKVERMLSESEETASRLRQQAFQDPVTGLANRRQFMDVLEHRIADPEAFRSGGLLLIQLQDFKAFNQAQGYVDGDELLAASGQTIENALSRLDRVTVAHLAGADFAALLEGVDQEGLGEAAAQVAAQLAGLYNRFTLPSVDVAHIGGAVFAGQDASTLLSEADMALREAQRAGFNAWVVRSPEEAAPKGRPGSEWRALLERALRERRFTLLRQAVLSCADGALLHHEVFLRLEDPERPGEAIPAAECVPMAESVGLAPQIDRAVVEATVMAMDLDMYPARVAVNLSPLSLEDDGLRDWMYDYLQKHREAAARLIIEFPEYGIAVRQDRLVQWIDRFQQLGVEFSLDHFGKGFSSFAYLRAIKAHYLKIDGSFIRNLDQHEDNQFFIKSVADIAHGLDMVVIAESVETEAVWQILQRTGIHGGRGYLLHRPE
jgi:diguanylate cyclase (GGDEF)-like protein